MIGKVTNIKSAIASKIRRIIRATKLVIIRSDLTAIPMPIENPTKPSRYSFFSGLKKVWIRIGREKSWKKALFNEP